MKTTNNVIDLSILKKKEFQVGDKTLELDTSDLKIIPRFEKMYPILMEEGSKIADLDKYVKDEGIDIAGIADALENVDKAMRHAIDFIFDSNVCEICVDHGSMFDPINGEYRFEHIINALLPLYDSNLTAETRKIQNRIKKHTAKYEKK